MAYKQNPRSPIAKSLVGNQHKLPQHLQDAIKAAPESPAKMYGDSPAKQTHTTKVQGRTVETKGLTSARKLGKTHASKGKKDQSVLGGMNEEQRQAYYQGMRDYHNKK